MVPHTGPLRHNHDWWCCVYAHPGERARRRCAQLCRCMMMVELAVGAGQT